MKTIKIQCQGADILPIDAIVEFQGNLKKRTKKEIDLMIKSIEQYGFSFPFHVWQNGGQNHCLDGHGRLLALCEMRKRGYDLPLFPVVYVDAQDEAEAKNKLLRLNSQYGQMTIDSVLEFVDGLDVEFGDLMLPDGIMELGNQDKEETVGDDDAPEVQDEAVSQLGEIYELGPHRLMCGDSTDSEQVGRLMGGDKADLVFTDPPYGVSYQSNMRTKTDKFKVIENDNVILDFNHILENHSEGWVFVWTTWKVLNKWLEITKPLGFPTNMVIWSKGGGGIGDLKGTFLTDYEIALVFNRGAELCGKRIGSVWSIGKDGASKYVHPTQKPVELGIEAIDKTTNKGNIILDIFGGSGSTLIACAKTGRVCRMMELDPKYCDVIRRRWTKWARENGHEVGSGYLEPLEEPNAK